MVTHALIRLAPYSHTPSSMLIKSLCRRYTEHISPSPSGLRRTSFVRRFSLVSAVWREVIGIDFSRVSAAVMDEDGNPKMIEISDRKICMPSVVSFDQKDAILDQTVFGIKRLIGRSYDELDAKELKQLREKLVPNYEIIPPDSKEEEEEAWIRLTNGKKYSPTYFASFIIGKLMDETAKCRGNIYASHAVVSVPPFFDPAQRCALKEAAERQEPPRQLLVDVLDESFAASLYYMRKSNTKKGRFAVIDLGGGSFDMSIINASNTICGPEIKKIATKHEESSMKEFEDHSIKHLCWSCLKEANMRPKEVDEVLLVGGMSRVPRVWELVKEIFGKRPVEEVNPDEAVALGAAIMANLNANS